MKTFIQSINALFSRKETKGFLIFSIVLTTLCLFLAYYIQSVGSYPEKMTRIADFFNGIATPVISLLTVVLIYNSFMLQDEQLKDTKKSFAQSENRLKLERVESISFKLLEKYENARDGFQMKYVPEIFVGKPAIQPGIPSLEALKHRFIEGVSSIETQSNQGTEAHRIEIEQKISSLMDLIEKHEDYKAIKSLIYRYSAIYKVILETDIDRSLIDPLVFSLNVQLSKAEEFFIKIFINQMDDLGEISDAKLLRFNCSDDYIYRHFLNN